VCEPVVHDEVHWLIKNLLLWFISFD